MSQKEADLDTLGRQVSNTNPLLYNVPGVVGLKTGTTNMAGDCLIALIEAEDADGRIHRLVAIQLGAEDETERATITEEMIRYAKQRLKEES